MANLAAKYLSGAGRATRTASWGVKGKMFRLITGGGLLTFGIGLPYEVVASSRGWREELEAEHLSRIMKTVQSGPFGTGDRPYGMGPNFGGSAGMTLAAHYAANRTGIRNPFFGLATPAIGMGNLEPASRFMGG